MNFLHRLRFRFRDWLHYSRLPRELMGIVNYTRALLPGERSTQCGRTLEAYRFTSIPLVKERCLSQLKNALNQPIWRADQIGWDRYAEQMQTGSLSRTVILKSPHGNGEKGVMIVTFEYNWLRLLKDIQVLQSVERDYDIIFSTSSSPTNYHMLALAVSSLKGTVFVQACNYDEIKEIEALHPRLKCLPMLPCDWLEPNLFKPRPRHERDIDILMVANWHPVKRHWHFFESMRSLDPKVKVVMVGQQADQFDLGFVKNAAKSFGVAQKIEFHQSLQIEQVADLQARSRVSAIFSRREGCCVAVTESLMANTPVALIADAHIGPKTYINAQTGVLIRRDRNSGRQLQGFLDRSDQFDARVWAMSHVSSVASTARLGAFLREHSSQEGRPWTMDLLAPCWRPHPTLLHNNQAERLRPAYYALHQKYPDLFPVDLFEASYR